MLSRFAHAASATSSVLRGGAGSRVLARGARPERLLELYEFEACPFCRKVREALSMLDLEAMVHPCPKGGTRFRPGVVERGGRSSFPYLVDPNGDLALYESDDIVAYLFERYGDGVVPRALRPGWPMRVTTVLAGLPRLGAGGFARPGRVPEAPLQLFSYESSPGARRVRESLSSLELRYRLTNVAAGSAHQDALRDRSGADTVPWLDDPNTGTGIAGAEPIRDYLTRTYATGGS
ncbi:MAG: glutathione S-transferase N-terminal domain-containing protein [Myxococcota bacterium]